MEETKSRNKRAKVEKHQLVTQPSGVSDLAVTPELLITLFQKNYMQCTQLQKRGVRKLHDLTEKKMERALLQSRNDWSATLNMLLDKQERLEDLLRSMGLICPETLLGVPAQQLDKLERVTFWARTVCVGSGEGVVGEIRQLLDEVTELKFKVKTKHSLLETLSADLISWGTRHQSLLTDCLTLNTPTFELNEVLTQSVYNPLFDHNDVFHFFPDLPSVVSFYTYLPERCVREQCVPPGLGLQKLKDSVKPSVENLAAGCFIGLMVITNLEDNSDGNDVVNYDHMCVSVGEQLSGTSLQPGKKYVTWYVGQYAQNNVIGSVQQWTEGMDYLFYSLSKCPAACNQEFLRAWKATRVPGFQRPLYTCVLPGTKEVTAATWGTPDTLDWIARSVHFWSHQLNTYAPMGYNLQLNHHFHRTLFLEIPNLVKFPLLWQYKELLTCTIRECKAFVEDAQRGAVAANEFLSAMKQEFFSCNFHLVFYQWAPVKERVMEFETKFSQCEEGMKKLNICMEVIQQSVETKVNQVYAWSRLYKLDITEAVGLYSANVLQLCANATALLQSMTEFQAPVTILDMDRCEQDLKNLEPCNQEWVFKMCAEVNMLPLSADNFYAQFSNLKKKIKHFRNLHHPDRGVKLVSKFYETQGWCEQLESIGKFHEHFFNKVR